MDDLIFFRADVLEGLYAKKPLSEKLKIIHRAIQASHASIDRVAVALHDAPTDMLRTFIFSETGDSRLVYYDSPLSDSITMQEIVRQRRPRVIQDMAVFEDHPRTHAQKLKECGFGSSYTIPLFFNDTFLGLIFINSYQRHYFDEAILPALDVFGHLIANIVINELNALRIMLSFFDLLIKVAHERDPETSDHIERVSRITRVIALELARNGEYTLTDEDIEYMSAFAGLHDLGKMTIPDNILFKPGRLNQQEWSLMKTHAPTGGKIIEDVIHTIGHVSFSLGEMAHNIPQHHHENMDGSGYPIGLKQEDIPIEARIVAVADVFDALVSERPYKPAWTNEDALEELKRLTQFKLDRRCVKALEKNLPRVQEIQREFAG